MSNRRKGSSGQVVSLTTALFLIAATLVIVIGVGLLVGNALFWKKNEVVSVSKIDLDFQRIKKIAEQNPQNPEAQVAYAGQLLIRKRYDEALTVMEKAYEMDREGQASRLGLGLAYKENGQYDKTIEVLKPLVQQYPFFFLAQYNLALSYQKTGFYEDAVKSYKGALRINPGAADVYLDLARTYAEMGNVDEAEKNVQQALRFVPDYKEALDFQKSLGSR